MNTVNGLLSLLLTIVITTANAYMTLILWHIQIYAPLGRHLPSYSLLQKSMSLLQFPFFYQIAKQERGCSIFIEGN
jgi:hypothetical protein